MKNKARLPRTAGLRTITELTTDLTNAGLDPSRVQERAVMIAKMRGGARKRGRDEDGDWMDVDDDDEEAAAAAAEEDGGNADTMEIDGEEEDADDDDTPHKRSKANSGAAIARKRTPHSNRQFAGMRDEAVRSSFLFPCNITDI